MRSLSDLCQVFKVAQQNREFSAEQIGIEPADLRYKSHLIVRITPETMKGSSIDFVELCSSDLAANSEIATNSREQERGRQFATESFNSLSKVIIAKARDQKPKIDSLIAKYINLQGHMLFCVNVSAESTAKSLRHNLTALKFSQKIRDAIVRKARKRDQQREAEQENNSLEKNISAIEQELSMLRDKLLTDSPSKDDQLVSQFSDILDKYESRVHHYKATVQESQQTQQKGTLSLQEIKKMRSDLESLRKELEADETSISHPSHHTLSHSPTPEFLHGAGEDKWNAVTDLYPSLGLNPRQSLEESAARLADDSQETSHVNPFNGQQTMEQNQSLERDTLLEVRR